MEFKLTTIHKMVPTGSSPYVTHNSYTGWIKTASQFPIICELSFDPEEDDEEMFLIKAQSFEDLLPFAIDVKQDTEEVGGCLMTTYKFAE